MAGTKDETRPSQLPPYRRIPAWRRVALLYNLNAGGRHEQRAARIVAAMAVLRKHGIEVEAIPTEGPGTAGRQAREAVERGFEVVLACGGDGTVHEVLQGMVDSPAALGVIPLGTANALAADIGLPRSTAGAARALLRAESVPVGVARVACADREGHPLSRYFIAAAGVGPDAHLFYSLQGDVKHRLGYAAYYLKAAQIWLTHDYPLYEIEFTSGDRVRHERVTQLLAVRIGNMGGLVRRLAPGAGLDRPDLRLVLFKRRSRLPILLHMLNAVTGVTIPLPGVELVNADRVVCRPLETAGPAPVIRTEADGEVLGRLPVTLEMTRQTVNLLMPRRKR